MIFARCGELDTEVDETLTAVLYVDGIDDQMCPVSTSCYIADGSDPTFYVYVEFSDFALTEHRDSESAELVIYREVSTTGDRTEVVRTTVTLVSA